MSVRVVAAYCVMLKVSNTGLAFSIGYIAIDWLDH